MDIFWVFILLFGIIISIGQKAGKQQPSQDEEMERRIRELLEGKPLPKAPQPLPKPANIPAPATVKRNGTPQPSVRPATSSKAAIQTHSATTATRSIKNTNNTPAKANKAINPIKQGEIKQSEIGRIIDDFTIEKATIYAEIMRPKYEEY